MIESATPVLDREHEIQLGMESIRLVTSKVPVSEPGGAVVGLVGVTRDVTAAREAERGPAAARSAAAGNAEARKPGVLAGGIAHDFNNLLTGVLGNISLARLQLDNSEATSSHLDGIETSAMRAADLCQQMLAYAGKGRFHEQRLDLGALVTDMLPLLRLSVAKGVSLQRRHRARAAGDVGRPDADAPGRAEPGDQRLGRHRRHRHHRDPRVRGPIARGRAGRAGAADRAGERLRLPRPRRSATPAAA